MKRIAGQLNFSNIVALLALFVALGGTSYAVSRLPRNSVGKDQLKKNAVISSKVKNGTLLKDDFKKGQLPKGDKGDKGEQGLAGLPGATGPSEATHVERPVALVDLATSYGNVLTITISEAGPYDVSTSVLSDSDSGAGNGAGINCRFTVNGVETIDRNGGLGPGDQDNQLSTLTFSHPSQLNAGDVVALECRAVDAADGVDVVRAEMTAIKLGSLTELPDQ
jgi:hypothetical protein